MFETAQMFFAAGRPGQAAMICRKLLGINYRDGSALHLLGVIEYQAGNPREALRLYSELTGLQPDNPAAWSNRGVASLALGEFGPARDCFERAVALAPEYADAWNNLGSSWKKEDLNKAEACYRQALALDPDMVDACNNLALICKKRQRYSEAIELYRTSLSLRPEQPEVLCLFAEVLEQSSATGEACEAYARSLALRPDDGIALKLATVLPVLIPAPECIEPVRAALWESLTHMHQQGLSIDKPWEKGRILFHLAYHGRNDRPFHELMAAIYRKASPDLTWQAAHVGRPRRHGERLKVGFVSRFLYNHTIAKLNLGYIRHLDRSRFTVVALMLSTGMDDAMTDQIREAADVFVSLTGDFPAMRRRIADEELDFLIYTDIGMETMSYFMAFARLAPLQCVTWGHPATSGIDTVDWFISHEECETEESRGSYSEKLFCLSPAATCTCYARPVLESSGRTLASFGIEPGRTVYYCPQPLFKIHPDFDPIMTRILERDPNGMIVLLRGGMPQIETLLRERLRASIRGVDERIRFLDPLPFGDYLAMMEAAHVVLDTPHFSGGNSTVEGLAVGAPIVTLPSQFLKGRLTCAWYRKLGIGDCIASSADEYVEIAVSLGQDPEKRQKLRERIRGASHLLFDDLQAVRELESFMERSLPA